MGSSPHYREEVCLEYVDEFPLVVRGQWLYVKKKKKNAAMLVCQICQKMIFQIANPT